jgi:hypothetical protein
LWGKNASLLSADEPEREEQRLGLDDLTKQEGSRISDRPTAALN